MEKFFLLALVVVMMSQICLSSLPELKEKLASIANAGCSFPPPDAKFKYELYEGKWFEIGKIQTKGGAFFEKDCVCTELNIQTLNYTNGDSLADNDCRYKTVDGKWTNVTGTLSDANPPGKWLETIYGNPVNYTVIAIDENYAVEYDCGTSMGITNYCVHVMSRDRTMDENLFNSLIQMAEDMGLNPQKLPVTRTMQDGC
jgi:apolipoprotein D and lipocalin family protein